LRGSSRKPSPGLHWLNTILLLASLLAAPVLAAFYVAWKGIHWSEIASLLTLWWSTGLGITAGYHRLFAHRAWAAPAPVRLVLAVLGAAAWQTSAIVWAATHRRHHKHVDTEDDPYNAKRGFFFSHMGWAMHKDRPDVAESVRSGVPDLWRDPICVWQHRHYLLISSTFNLGVLLLLGILSGRMLGMLLFAGLLRVVLVHHFTFCINSLAHRVGRQPWSEGSTARDNAALSLLTLGEGYHNYHHAFPTDYRNGVRWYHPDPTKWFIWTLDRLGLAFDLRRSSLDRRVRVRLAALRKCYRGRLGRSNDVTAGRLIEAEARLEGALEELGRIRLTWLERSGRGSGRTPERELQSTYRRARRALAVAFRRWERLAVNWAS